MYGIMNFNPLLATNQIQKSYVDFYKTNFALGNNELSEQLNKLSENNRLWREPFISISQNYIQGKSLEDLQPELNLQEDLVKALPFSNLFRHQENAITHIVKYERDTLVSSGTGSGKTESFLLPVLNECAKKEVPGLKAILIYPMNALANDQVDRLRDILYNFNIKRAKTGKREITFGIYTGPTPETIFGQDRKISQSLSHLTFRCPSCHRSTALKCSEENGKGILTCKYEKDVKIKFQLLSRNELKENPPDILITNYVMLERILVREKDKALFDRNKVKFLVLDEMHAYGGAKGVDVALLVRRFKRRLWKDSLEKQKIICIGTSATMSKDSGAEKRKNEIRKFGSRLFGVKFTNEDIFEGERVEWVLPPALPIDNFTILDVPNSIENFTDENFKKICKQISTKDVPILENIDAKSQFLGSILLENSFFQELIKSLYEPRSINELKSILLSNEFLEEKLKTAFDSKTIEELIWSYLKTGSLAKNPNQHRNEPLLKVGIHNFFRILPKVFKCSNLDCREMYFTHKDVCEKCEKIVEELAVCRNCSEEFFVSLVLSDEIKNEGSKKTEKQRILKKLEKAIDKDKQRDPEKLKKEIEEYSYKKIKRISQDSVNENPEELWYKIIDDSLILKQLSSSETTNDEKRDFYKKCLDCGSFNLKHTTECEFEKDDGYICGSKKLISIETFRPSGTAKHKIWRPRDCPVCHFAYGGAGWAVTKFEMAPKQASTNLFNIVFENVTNHKLLIFTDSRQDAAELSRWLDFAHEDTAIKQLIVQKLTKIASEGRHDISYRELVNDELMRDITRKWYDHNLKDFDRDDKEIEKKILLAITDKKRLAVERLGLIECNYMDLKEFKDFKQLWKATLENYQFDRELTKEILDILNLETKNSKSMNHFVITILNMMRRYEAIEGLEKRDWNEKFEAEGFDWDIQNKTIPHTKGTKIFNLAVKRANNRFLAYTKKVFELENNSNASEIAIRILESVWNFIKKNGYVVKVLLQKYENPQNPLAYVVATKQLRLSIPKRIQRCEKCNEVYTNLPNNNCQTVIRQKLCDGKTIEIKYTKFLEDKKDDHFFRTFKDKEPTRMATKEHTGALSDEDKKIIQDSFSAEQQNDRKVDVIVATPTLELGVDIGDLSSVGLYKSPPSAISYIQRVGRAGRRDGISFINTFFFNSPIDEFYFRNPQELIKGNFYPPFINFENEELIKRHFNSVVLEEIAFSDLGKMFSETVDNFIKSRDENTKKIFDLVESKKDILSESFRMIFDDLPDHKKKFEVSEKIQEFTKDFKSGFGEALDYFREEQNSIQKTLNEYRTNGRRFEKSDLIKLKELENKDDELANKKLDNHLFDCNFLPRFAFPGKLVEIEDTNGSFYHGGRPRNIALSEFAPKSEITWKKKTYKSIGIDPKHPEFFSICNNCKKFFSTKNIVGTICPYCSKEIQSSPQIRSISPDKIYIQEKTKSVTESSNYIEPRLDAFLPKPKNPPIEKLVSLESYDIELTKYGNTSMLLTVRDVFTEFGDPEEDAEQRIKSVLELCRKCGKVKEVNDRNIHNKKPINKKFITTEKKCLGEFEEVSLHHIMPTNVVTIKIKDKKEDKTVSGIKFLITLKNALIFAGQSIAEAMEGEIEGVIKEDELILFDNVDGGAGYVDTIFDRFNEVLKRAYEIISKEEEYYKEVCDKGCLRCLWSYRRKRDIPLIDKHAIYPLLQQSSNLSIEETQEIKKKLEIFEFEKIESHHGSVNTAAFVKKTLQKATNQIRIFTPIINDKKIDWDDDRVKSWIDILGSLKLGSENVSISIFLKNLSNQDESVLRQLLAMEIDVFSIDDDSFDKCQISDESLIIIDQFSEQKQCMVISHSLTNEITNSHSFVKYSSDEKTSNQIKKNINVIESFSKKIGQNEISSLSGDDFDIIRPYNTEDLKKAISNFNNFISSTENEITIVDAYLDTYSDGIKFYLSYLAKYLKEGILIKIVTTGQEKNKLITAKTWFESLGYHIDIISIEQLGKFKHEKILHDRFVFVDHKKGIKLGKGLNIIFELDQKNHSKDLISNDYYSDLNKVRTLEEKTFYYVWNYQENSDEEIKNWPKIDTRFLK